MLLAVFSWRMVIMTHLKSSKCKAVVYIRWEKHNIKICFATKKILNFISLENWYWLVTNTFSRIKNCWNKARYLESSADEVFISEPNQQFVMTLLKTSLLKLMIWVCLIKLCLEICNLLTSKPLYRILIKELFS